MIQRKQSIWLFLAAMLTGALFIFPLFTYQPAMSFEPVVEGVRNYVPLFLVAAVSTLLPLVTIFMFGNRKRQKGLTIMSMIANAAILLLLMMHIGNVKEKLGEGATVNYALPGMLLPIAAIIFLILAYRGIRHDDKLIKSLDRLR